jgi:hypothetical protein
MWTTKIFKTQALLDKWLSNNEHKIQHNIIYINNAFGLEYKPLRKVL